MKKIKLYTVDVNGTIVNLKNCPLTCQALPSIDEILKCIQTGQIPLRIHTDENVYKEISSEIRKRSCTINDIGFFKIYIQSTTYRPIILLGLEKKIDQYAQEIQKLAEQRVEELKRNTTSKVLEGTEDSNNQKEEDNV